jgi:hypothetical protein
MLKGIRVSSKDELVVRIYQYFREINETPVVLRWKYKMEDIIINDDHFHDGDNNLQSS